MDPSDIRIVCDAIARASSLLFVTGAGLSADSGLPTYRGIGGLYDRGPTEDGVPIEVALSGPMFRAQPERTWKHIAQIEAACRGALPNRGHEIIAAFEALKPRVWVVTQNVDGLHLAAGSQNLIDIHGDIHHLICTQCDFRTTVDTYQELEIPPRCPTCKSILRPDVVLFGEMLSGEKVAVMEREYTRGFDVVLSVGTSSVFPYIAQPMVDGSEKSDVLTVEINPGSSEVSDLCDVRLQAGAADALTEIWLALTENVEWA